tara:strand:- start:692 stop:898 length:207 start_codon:yes stop_codon:yes gene_type:complete
MANKKKMRSVYTKFFKKKRTEWATRLKEHRADPRINYYGGPKKKREREDYLSKVVNNFDELLGGKKNG